MLTIKLAYFFTFVTNGLLKGSAITAGNVRRIQLRDLWKQPAWL